jgi:hypothetical protein
MGAKGIGDSLIECKICGESIKWQDLTSEEQDIVFHPKNEQETINLFCNKVCLSCLREEKIRVVLDN